MEKGYYWIKFKDDDEIIIGYYDNGDLVGEYNQEMYSDDSGEPGQCYPWKIVGSEEIFKNCEVEILGKVKGLIEKGNIVVEAILKDLDKEGYITLNYSIEDITQYMINKMKGGR